MQQVTLAFWILLGYVIVSKVRVLDEKRIDSVRSFAFTYLAPALFFSSMYRADLTALPSLQVFGTYLLTLVLIFIALRYYLVKVIKESHSASNIKAIAGLYPNAVGLGVPIIFSLYGPDAELILMGIIFTNLVVILPCFNILMIQSGEDGFFSYRKVVTDPIFLAIWSGFLLNSLNVMLPIEFTDFLKTVGLLGLPLILTVLGGSLSFYKLTTLLKEKITVLLWTKLIWFPFFILILGQYIFVLSPIEIQVLVIVSCLPTGVNVYMLASRYQAARQAVASVILITTMLSLVSLYAWEQLLGLMQS